MPDTYTYQVRDQSGNLRSGTIVADNQTLVLERLREQGLVPVSIAVQKGLKLNMEFNVRQKVKLKDLAIFSRQFSTMVSSGLPMLRALATLETQTGSKALSKAVADVRIEVEKGSSLSGAMSKHPKVFNNLYVAMVKSGETGGVLDAVLDRLAGNLEREVSLRGRIKSAMTYPIVVLGFVTLIMMAMLIFIVPQFKSIYAELHGTLPLLTRMLLAVSDAVRHDFIFVVAGIALMIWGLRRWKRTESGGLFFDKLKLRAPIFGPLFQKTALSRFARTLSVMSKSGVPIIQSLDVVAETVNNRVMSEAVRDVQESVKQGESIAKPLSRHEVFPGMVVQMLTVGEETGALDTMLEKIAQFYDDEVTAAVDSLTSILEPVMIAIVGGAVGVAVIALYMPMFNIINLIK
ncbi:MAG TPA: type II secretion system F family protein [Actinomycetota bacterium]|nr:type II secretion system F family protein [Actinomycetota bacterium]